MKNPPHPRLLARLLLAAAFLIGLVPAAHGAWYAKFDGVDGSAKHKDQSGWCEIVRFSNELTPTGPASPGGPPTLNFGDFVIVKTAGKSTPVLMDFCAKGTRIEQIELEIICIEENAAGDAKPICYLKYKLDRCFIKSWSVSGDADDRPTEELRIGFESLEVVAGDSEAPGDLVTTLATRVAE